jgi:hypothetical protein
VLLRQHSADIIARVERDLTGHVQEADPVVQQHLSNFPSQHPRETGCALVPFSKAFSGKRWSLSSAVGEFGKMKQFSHYCTSSRLVS